MFNAWSKYIPVTTFTKLRDATFGIPAARKFLSERNWSKKIKQGLSQPHLDWRNVYTQLRTIHTVFRYQVEHDNSPTMLVEMTSISTCTFSINEKAETDNEASQWFLAFRPQGKTYQRELSSPQEHQLLDVGSISWCRKGRRRIRILWNKVMSSKLGLGQTEVRWGQVITFSCVKNTHLTMLLGAPLVHSIDASEWRI